MPMLCSLDYQTIWLISYSLCKTMLPVWSWRERSMSMSLLSWSIFSGCLSSSGLTTKFCLLTFKALLGQAPSYIIELLDIYQPERDLRSSSQGLLKELRSRLKRAGDRAFSVYAPKTWNKLPLGIWNSTSINSFKTALKTHFFKPFKKEYKVCLEPKSHKMFALWCKSLWCFHEWFSNWCMILGWFYVYQQLIKIERVSFNFNCSWKLLNLIINFMSSL